MVKEEKTQTKINVGIEKLWRALSKDLRFVVPKAMPNLVKEVQVLEGNGGLNTILLFHFSGTIAGRYQKEKIVEYDESAYKIGLQVIDGGKLSCGFSLYTTYFELSSINDEETVVDVKVVYNTNNEEPSVPIETTNPTLFFLKSLENYLLTREL